MNIFIRNERMLGHLITYETIMLFGNLLITFGHYYYYAKYVCDFFNMVDFFRIFIISQSTQILIVLNFWLGVYT